jgi:hypothetical protein
MTCLKTWDHVLVKGEIRNQSPYAYLIDFDGTPGWIKKELVMAEDCLKAPRCFCGCGALIVSGRNKYLNKSHASHAAYIRSKAKKGAHHD